MTPAQQNKVKVAAHQIKVALDCIRGEPEGIRDRMMQEVMGRVQRYLTGEQLTIDGPGLVTEIPDPDDSAPINTEGKDQPEVS